MFRKYSLADTGPNLLTTPKKAGCNDTKTKIDSNSPGLSSRVVQYNEETKSTPNKSKYNKLGVFPIVHFFKKDLPIYKRKDIKFGSSELAKFNSQQTNQLLLKQVVKSNVAQQKPEINTQSVLEALKEISRKRIHMDVDEFSGLKDGKRMLADEENNDFNSKKRIKHQFGNDVSPKPRKCNPLDEISASQTSMENFPEEPSRKRKSEGQKSLPKATKPKYTDVETQTVEVNTPATPEVNATKTSPEVEVKKTPKQEKTRRLTSPIKVFDEKPLEAMRRNRLNILIGLPTKPDKEPVQKPLASILSPATKSPHNKHVTFNIPEVSNVETTTPATTNETPSTPTSTLYATTRTSQALVTPVVFTNVVTESTAIEKSPVSIAPTFTIDKIMPEKSVEEKIAVTSAAPPPPETPKQPAGFTFQLKTSPPVQKETVLPTTFPQPVSSQPISLFSPVPTISTPLTTNSEKFINFSSSVAPAPKPSFFNFASNVTSTVTTTPSFAPKSTNAFSFNANPVSTTSFGFGTNKQSEPKTSGFTANLTVPTTTIKPFSFGSTNTTTTSAGFDSNTNPVFKNSQFGVPVTTTSMFSGGFAKNPPDFGKNTPSFPASTNPVTFGSTSNNASGVGFGFASNTANPVAFPNSSAPFAFNNTEKPPVFSFEANKTPFSFQSETSAAPAFNFNGNFNNSVSSSPFNPSPGGQLNVPQAAAATGMFTIGAGGTSTPTRSRAMVKAKRRT